jgi:glycosyl transferase family 2
MHLAAVSIVRSECDIIESFVRHNATFFDRLYILDHRSTDTTPDILRRLADDGLPLVLSREGYGIFYQGPTMTHLIKRAFDDLPWDFIIPLDSDEFLRVPDRAALEAALADLDPASIGLSEVVNYVPTASDDADELDVLRRIMHRAKTRPDTGSRICKVVIPGAVIRQPGFSLNEGHHGVCIDGKPVAERRIEGLSLAHFPVRSIDQFILRTILCRLAWSSRSDYNPSWGWHYGTFFKQLKSQPAVSAADLTAAALLYDDIYTGSGQTPVERALVREPVTPAYDRLRFTTREDMAVLPPVLDMMEFVVDELRAARMSSAGYAEPAALEARTPARASGKPVAAPARADESRSLGHRFQSFWHGGALCLTSSFA